MKMRLVSTMLIVCMMACETSNSPQGASTIDKDKSKITSSIGSPIQVNGTNILVYPLTGTVDRGKYKSYRGRDYRSQTWNLAFFNLETGLKHLLFEDRVINVKDYESGNSLESVNGLSILEPTKGRLYYDLITQDLNKDSILDQKDMNELYSSDTAGYDLKRISPSNMDVHSWKFLDRQRTWIEFRGRFNNNMDSIIDNKDPYTILHVNINNDIQREVFSSDDQKELYELFESSVPKSDD